MEGRRGPAMLSIWRANAAPVFCMRPTFTVGCSAAWLCWFTSTKLGNRRSEASLKWWNQDGTRCKKVLNSFSIEPLFSRSTIAISIASGSGALRKAFVAYFHAVDGRIVPHNSGTPFQFIEITTGRCAALRARRRRPFLWEGLRNLETRKGNRGNVARLRTKVPAGKFPL
jgi:hypothetical protein